MTNRSDACIEERLKQYYQTSTRYRDDLVTHDASFLEPFLILIERYLAKNSRILDLGCGTGLSTRLIEERGYPVCGVDLSPLFLGVEKKANPQTNLLAGNALQLPFADNTFDAVVAFEFIEHITDVPALLNEMLRVLNDHGYIIIHSPNLVSPYLPAFDLLRMMLGGEGRPVFAEDAKQASQWLKQNLKISLKKKFASKPDFLYREPDLSERRIGGDSDSVYLANQMDLAKYFKMNGCAIDNLSHAMSLKNKFIVTLTPNFAPYIGLVTHKLP